MQVIGKIDSSLQLIDKIENRIFELTKEIKGEIKIATHPFICSHINKGGFLVQLKVNGRENIVEK